jgi:hypothetical protein
VTAGPLDPERHDAFSARMLVVLEDLQWAGPASLRLLEHLAFEGRAAPLLVLATLREGAGSERGALERTLALLRPPPVAGRRPRRGSAS